MKSSKTSTNRLSATVSKTGKHIRINKYLADCNIASRRKVEQLIVEGKITINGKLCTDLTYQIDPDKDKVLYQGVEVIPNQEYHYLIINKPRGYIITMEDEYSRRTIYDLLPEFAKQYVYAGRLDKDSEGLLLLTDDREMVTLLTHPKHKVEKVYRVQIDRQLNRNQLKSLREGVEIEGYKTQPAGVFVKSSNTGKDVLKVTIKEGRKRQIRLMVEAVGANVTALRRTQFGPIKIGKLPIGMWRFLNPEEIKELKRVVRKESK